MKSIFTNKQKEPSEPELKKALGSTFHLWKTLVKYTVSCYPEAIKQWHYAGDKFGWSFRISDKKRVIVYLLPRDLFFKVALVFGQKATESILNGLFPESIKQELKSAKVYAEGRGIRIDVRESEPVSEIRKLIQIKINH